MQLSDQSTFHLKVFIIKLESTCDQMVSNMFFADNFDSSALVQIVGVVLAFAWPELFAFLNALLNDVTSG